MSTLISFQYICFCANKGTQTGISWSQVGYQASFLLPKNPLPACLVPPGLLAPLTVLGRYVKSDEKSENLTVAHGNFVGARVII